MAKFKMGVTVPAAASKTSRLGSAADAGGRVTETERNKFFGLAGDSQFDLSVVGDAIEATMISLEPATQDGWSIGTVNDSGRRVCVCDGLQATPGTGTIAVGDLVVVGTPVAKATALTEVGPRVCKATAQTAAVHNWRVLSLGVAGAVGDTCLIERV